MVYLKIAFIVLISSNCFNAFVIPPTDNIQTNQADAMPCYVCEKAVQMTRENMGANYSDIKSAMISYCRSVYSQYQSNCIYIVNSYLLDIYTKSHVTPYSAEAICVSERLCPNKIHHHDGIFISQKK